MATTRQPRELREILPAFMENLKAGRPYRPDPERMRIFGQDRVIREVRPEEKAKVAQYIETHPNLAAMIEIEPMLRQLLEEASICTRGNRWHLYEYFKRAALPFVGWDACIPELCTSEAFDIWIYALDMLLPMESEEIA